MNLEVAVSPSISLTPHQISFFRAAGYMRLACPLEEPLVQRLRRKILEHVRKQVPPLRRLNGHVMRIDNLYDREGIFRETASHPLLLDALESLLGPNIVLTKNRHNHATLNRSGDTPPRLHRDILQWSRGLVTAIIYLDESDIEHGCTHIIPTSQYLPFVGTPNNGGTWMDEHSVYADLLDQAVPVPMKKGGILLLDSLAFHSVGWNRSRGTRMSFCFGYHAIDELSSVQDPTKVLLRGEKLYRGNDRF